MNHITVCRDCTGRYPACHDHCEKYKQAKAELLAEKELIFRNKSKDFVYEDYQQKKFKRYKRQI